MIMGGVLYELNGRNKSNNHNDEDKQIICQGLGLGILFFME
jgi:hypothetical protein